MTERRWWKWFLSFVLVFAGLIVLFIFLVGES